jgi:lipoate-protein ligase B
MDKSIEVIRLPGQVPYEDALRLQYERRDAIEAGQSSNALFLLEHTPVITLGRSAHEHNLLLSREELVRRGIAVYEANRGGDVTYHGPGQLVAYPVIDLKRWNPSIRWYLRTLEDVLIRQLARYAIKAGRVDGFTGVWVDGAKVAAIGVGVHNWVTFHGIALNVNPEMDHFRYIVPCGLAGKPVTSLAMLLGASPPMAQVMDDFAETFTQVFYQSATLPSA